MAISFRKTVILTHSYKIGPILFSCLFWDIYIMWVMSNMLLQFILNSTSVVVNWPVGLPHPFFCLPDKLQFICKESCSDSRAIVTTPSNKHEPQRRNLSFSSDMQLCCHWSHLFEWMNEWMNKSLSILLMMQHLKIKCYENNRYRRDQGR